MAMVALLVRTLRVVAHINKVLDAPAATTTTRVPLVVLAKLLVNNKAVTPTKVDAVAVPLVLVVLVALVALTPPTRPPQTTLNNP